MESPFSTVHVQQPVSNVISPTALRNLFRAAWKDVGVRFRGGEELLGHVRIRTRFDDFTPDSPSNQLCPILDLRGAGE